VVNDLGGSIVGEGADRSPAEAASAEIRLLGGESVADTNDISTSTGAEALVETAVARFGRVDILVNNAGIMRWARFPDVDEADFERHFAVHTRGSFLTARAVWPHLVAQNYGRIVMTASAGMFGLPNNTSYATAKGGVVGLARSLSTAGSRRGIRVNVIAPAAMTRMAGTDSDDDMGMPPQLVAPMVAYLVHEDCPVSGEIYAAGAGRFARIFIASTPGFVAGPRATVEDVARHWTEINAEDGYTVPGDLTAWSASFTEHLAPGSGESRSS
jgi:NAD(P)-dependent dehydrogenase (short-subunit alcohol dehydrogenase family)